jgi:hypothetical protein
MTSSAAGRRGTRAWAALALVVGALLALAGVATATDTDTATGSTSAASQHSPFGFD